MNIQFTLKNWKKDWASEEGLLGCEYFGYQYTYQLKDVLGISLEEALFISHNGITSCYFIDEYKKAFGVFLVGKAVKDPSLVMGWAENLVKTADRTLMLIE